MTIDNNLENNIESKISITHLPITTSELDRVFLKAAYDYAWKRSEDITTKTGAVIVRYNRIKMKGTNHFTDGTEDNPSKHDKENKYDLTIHAEDDLITKAAAKGIVVANTTMYMPWIPCISCYRNIKNSKIKKLVVHKEMIMQSPERWIENLNKTLYLANKANFPISMYEGIIGENTKSLFNGQIWNP